MARTIDYMEQFMNYYHRVFGIETLSQITFAQAINDQARLQAALADPDAMIIDSDITKGPHGHAVCAHWPLIDSDLSFDDLLLSVQRSHKGLKLDFKDSGIVADCLIKLNRAELSQPVILNADILSLEGSPPPDFDGKAFLETCRTFCPEGLISVGWRTEDNYNYPYTDKDIVAMLELVKNVRPIVFPIRTSLLPHSWPQLARLIDSNDTLLLLWSSTPVPANLQAWIVDHIPPNNMFREYEAP
jgi:hypothetical protein